MTYLVAGGDDVLRFRLAVSPLWETMAAVRTLVRGPVGPLGAWEQRARPRAARLDLDVLVALFVHGGYTPDFLTPPPPAGERKLRVELDQVRATSLDVVAHELERCLHERRDPPPVGDPLPAMLVRPALTLRRVVRALDHAWQELVSPWWPRLHRVLAGDLDHRSRRLVAGGTAALLDDLHPAVRWRAGRVEVADGGTVSRDLAGEGLVLLPSVFQMGRPVVFVDPPYQPMIVYGARGVATAWDRSPAPAQALVGLLGRGRAEVLAALDAAAGTGALAAQLGRSQAGVSEHVAAMREAGLVATTKAGRGSRHQRTELGDALVAGPLAARPRAASPGT